MGLSVKTLAIWVVVASAVSAAGCERLDLANEHFCTQLLSPTETKDSIGIKAAAPRSSLWRHNAFMHLPLTIKFLNGSPFQRQRVMQYAREWVDASVLSTDPRGIVQRKISMTFVPDAFPSATTDVRVWFGTGGSSAYIGSEARAIPPDQPTVFFGWVNEQTPEAAIRQVVLHEFGHVLGLVHEHQSPAARIPWNRDRVYEYYRLTQTPPWTRADVDRNIFALYDAATTNYSAYDPKSIMHYAIPASLTTDGSSTPWNWTLSATDEEYIKKFYPFFTCSLNESENCCFDRQGRRIPCI